MKNIFKLGLVGVVLGLASVSCEPEYDVPPVEAIPEGKLITIDTLYNWFATQGPISITEDYSLYGVITTDETTGNFYKVSCIQDGNRGITLRFTSSSSMSIGDSVRVYLKGAYLNSYNSLMQLDSLDPDKNIIIQSNGNDITPIVVDMNTVASTETIGGQSFYKYQSRLVQFDDVQFRSSGTWADAINQFSVNHDLEDCNGSSVLVRTSGYANFAGDVIPSGKGTFYGIMSVYGTDIQMLVRTPNEQTLSGPRCGAVSCDPVSTLFEDFSLHTTGGAVNQYCWSTYSSPSSAAQWTVASGSSKYASSTMSGTGTTGSQDMWLISPEITYSSSNILSFTSAVQNYTHAGLQVYILTNYSGNPTTATQTAITTATLAGSGTGNGIFVSSGNIALSGFGISGTYRIAFKYTGNPVASQTGFFMIDDFNIQ
ncbi:MAG: choice-of-anchor J domain-containing protein [Flavobacteriales bacterium]|nr:choice-of-anchor J domain-containing protein [Flavobacteriales bacterium]MCB9198259.1 choice-of-anchor J domain-containing protein [Flavobacteriales bacterium]